MKNNKQTINCDVHDCYYCNCESNCCSLKEIKISNCNNNKNKEATICDSYNRKNT